MLIPLGIVAASGAGPSGAFESIATVTGNGSASTLTFSSIPSGFQHLQIRSISKDTGTSTGAEYYYTLRFNSDSGSNYAWHRLKGSGTGVSANSSTSATQLRIYGGMVFSTSDGFGVGIVDIHDYASTTKNKTVRSFSGVDGNSTNSSFFIDLGSGLWMNTSAITSITLGVAGTAFSTTSQFALYGIKGA